MDIILIFKAIILGIVEGITEWLPVSSTGHMILVDEFINLNVSPAFKEMFFVVIQLGAVMAVVVLYWKKLFPFSTKEKFLIKEETFQMWFKIVVACIPAAVVGILFDDKIDELFYNYQTVALALIMVGIAFIIVEKRNKECLLKQSFLILHIRMQLLLDYFNLLQQSSQEHLVQVQL